MRSINKEVKNSYQRSVQITLGLVFFLSLMSYRSYSQNLPYPLSPVIKGISLNWSTHQRGAMGSDNFQLTWADDDNLYGAWGDGGGFAGNSNKICRVPLGVAYIKGSGDNWEGHDVWGDPECAENVATFNGKSWGMISVDGVLYMWAVSDHKHGHFKFINLTRSFDHGATWEKSNWQFKITDHLSIPTFINFGKDNAGAKDDFVYSYFIHIEDTTKTKFDIHAKGGKMYLARVHKDKLWEGRESYQWFNGLKKKKPQWGSLTEKRPVFKDPNGVGWCLSAFYNFGLERYILTTEHTETHLGIMGMFDAPEPWGPWTTIKYWTKNEYFGKSRPGDTLEWANNVFYVAFNNKWMSKDGMDFTLNFTGGGRGKDNDSFNTLSGSFIRSEE